MKLKITILLLCILAMPVQAQGKLTLQQAITKMNRIQPLQNPRYETADQVLGRNILDSSQKVAGEVKDIIINQENGNVSSILADFDRLNLNQPAYLNFESLDIKSFSKGYGIGFRSEVIKEIYPTLLADIETAGNGNMIGLKSIINRRVTTNEGKNIGRVDNVLFNRKATRAIGLHVNVTSGTIFDEGITIPFVLAQFVEKDSGPEAQINQLVADYMVEYLTGR